MSLFYLVIVALVQGVTEFLPISSSAHLILLPYFTGQQDQGQVIDVAVHVGTLGAVILYFRSDVARAVRGLAPLLRGDLGDANARLALGLAVATLPVIAAGLILEMTGYDSALRSVTVIGWATLIFGLLLWWMDRTGAETRRTADWTLRDALVMGVWQAVALIPGTSRSGITITAARKLGYHRHDAARLSMLMSIPTIVASGVLLGAEVVMEMDATAAYYAAIGAVFAFIAALGALALMMRLLRTVSFTPYVIYRVILGAGLLAISYL